MTSVLSPLNLAQFAAGADEESGKILRKSSRCSLYQAERTPQRLPPNPSNG